jgi:hypothetical protein
MISVSGTASECGSMKYLTLNDQQEHQQNKQD